MGLRKPVYICFCFAQQTSPRVFLTAMNISNLTLISLSLISITPCLIFAAFVWNCLQTIRNHCNTSQSFRSHKLSIQESTQLLGHLVLWLIFDQSYRSVFLKWWVLNSKRAINRFPVELWVVCSNRIYFSEVLEVSERCTYHSDILCQEIFLEKLTLACHAFHKFLKDVSA